MRAGFAEQPRKDADQKQQRQRHQRGDHKQSDMAFIQFLSPFWPDHQAVNSSHSRTYAMPSS